MGANPPHQLGVVVMEQEFFKKNDASVMQRWERYALVLHFFMSFTQEKCFFDRNWV